MAFAEIRLDLGYDYGMSGGPNFSTQVVPLKNGKETRNQNWLKVRGRWELGERDIIDTTKDTIYDFFMMRKGRLQGFRLRDWADYRLVDEPLTTAATDTTIQLIKTYGSGADAYVRNIIKPAALTPGGDYGYLYDPVTLYRNSVLETGWSLDTTTGIITLASPVVALDAFTWSGEYDKPVRFDRDEISFEFRGYRESDHRAAFFVSALSAIEEKP